MIILGRYLVGLLFGLLTPTALLLGASIGGLRGETPMLVASIVVMLGWAVFAAGAIYSLTRAIPMLRGHGDAENTLRWTRRSLVYLMVLAPFTGLGLAFISFIDCGPIWIPNLYHWAGLVGTVLAFAAFYTLPVIARACLGHRPTAAQPSRWWVIALVSGLVAVLWGLAWLIPYLILRGSVEESQYAGAPGTFKLPWQAGESSWVIQGNDSGLNHNNDNSGQKFSWDFRRPCGSAVLAAEAGQVTAVTDTNDGIGGDNNGIEVTHADGSVASYLHIQNGSAVVAVGTMVQQGDGLARAGCVGNSLTGHIHFMVKSGGTTIPITFADVSTDDGIPRAWSSYTSGNR